MAEFEAGKPAREHEEWLASLADRGVEVSPPEKEFMQSGHKLVPLLEQVLEMHALYNQHVGLRAEEIQQQDEKLQQRITSVASQYEETAIRAQDPVVLREENLARHLEGQSRTLEELGNESEILQAIAAGMVTNSKEVFPTIRALVLQMASTDPAYSKDEFVPREAKTTGFGVLLQNAETLLGGVVQDSETQEVVVSEKSVEPQKSDENDNGRLFDSWEEVFGIEELEKQKEVNPNFVQEYRNAIKRIYSKYPEKFEDCGEMNGKGRFDWLKAIEPVLGLTVGELNEAINSEDGRTVNTSARIVALANRWVNDKSEYIHHDNLIEKTNEIRALGKKDNTRITHVLKPEKPKEQEVVVVYHADEDTSIIKEHDEKETAINFVDGTLREMHRQVAGRYSVEFPLTMMTHRKISLYWKPGGKGDGLEKGKAIKAEFMRKMEKLGYCVPTGPITGQTHHSYTEKETIKIFTLSLMNAENHNKRGIQQVMNMIDKGYEEGTARFQDWLRSQNH